MDSAQRRKTPGLISCIATTAIAGLAAGALWCLLALSVTHGAGFLIVPLGAAMGWYFHWLGFPGKRCAICAMTAVLIAFVYAQYLFAAVRIAQMLGFPLRNTLFRMDLGLAWQGALANLGAWDFVWLALACAIAAWLAMRISVRQ
ncbi:MAG: hypothetical protein DYH18_08980 [Xanthomonadales bacterium PRO7]|jgi:hypothetical protein|nr:hypothetical protein [Xanthomonadales bacterium PRO7]HMM57182.1 hypothetical protein [Rudaea sp.]